MATMTSPDDRRPRIYDTSAAAWALLDSGAAVTVFPRAKCKKPPPSDNHRHLQAINGTTIKTYGTRDISFDFGQGRRYRHQAIIADINEPIIGWDFTSKFNLDLNWQKDGRCRLVDKKANKYYNLRLQPLPHYANQVAVVQGSFKK